MKIHTCTLLCLLSLPLLAQAPRLGILVDDVKPPDITALNLPGERGTIVRKVDPGSLAARTGIRPYDVITELNGRRVDSVNELIRRLDEQPAGRPIAFTLVRGGDRLTLTTPRRGAGAPPPETPALPKPELRPRPEALGIEVLPIRDQLAAFFGVPDSPALLVSQVEPEQRGATAGLRAGDVLISAHGKRLRKPADIVTLLREHTGRDIEIQLIRDHETIEILLPAPSL